MTFSASYDDLKDRVENYKYEFAKIVWPRKDGPPDGFVIVQKFTPIQDVYDDDDTAYAIFVYGSKRKYDSCGTIYYFRNYTEVIELDEEYVMKNYFPGILR